MSGTSRDASGGDTTLETSKDDTHVSRDSDDENHNDSPILCSDDEDDERNLSRTARGRGEESGDPVKVLQLSQQFYVSDTMDEEEDVSLIIPPTPSTAPYIIPSTPVGKDGDQDTVALVSGNGHGVEKQLIFDEDEIDNEWTKPTQQLSLLKRDLVPGDGGGEEEEDSDNDETFADTDVLLADCYNMPTQRNILGPVETGKSSVINLEEHMDDDDDEWNLRLTASQATQLRETTPIRAFDAGKEEQELSNTFVNIAFQLLP